MDTITRWAAKFRMRWMIRRSFNLITAPSRVSNAKLDHWLTRSPQHLRAYLLAIAVDQEFSEWVANRRATHSRKCHGPAMTVQSAAKRGRALAIVRAVRLRPYRDSRR